MKKKKHADHPAWMTRQAPAFLPPARRKMKKRRNAGGFGGGDQNSLVGTAMQIAAGVGAGVGAYWAASKLHIDPKWATLGVAGVGTAVALAVKSPVARKVGLGAAIGSGTLGGMSLVMDMRSKSTPSATPAVVAKAESKRQADGEGVTRAELQDALTKAAEGAKQSQSELLDVLRAEILRTVEGAIRAPRALPAPSSSPAAAVRGADGYGYDERNADGYGYADERNADGYGYADERNADGYGYADERNADGYEERNADGYEERNGDGYDERNADGYEERNADGYDERNADGYEERNADGNSDERNSDGYDERNADGYDERNADGYDERNADGVVTE